jgi:hypothetical protein
MPITVSERPTALRNQAHERESKNRVPYRWSPAPGDGSQLQRALEACGRGVIRGCRRRDRDWLEEAGQGR